MSNALFHLNTKLDAANKSRDEVKERIAKERARHAQAMALLERQLDPLREEIADLIKARTALMGIDA